MNSLDDNSVPLLWAMQKVAADVSSSGASSPPLKKKKALPDCMGHGSQGKPIYLSNSPGIPSTFWVEELALSALDKKELYGGN